MGDGRCKRKLQLLLSLGLAKAGAFAYGSPAAPKELDCSLCIPGASASLHPRLLCHLAFGPLFRCGISLIQAQAAASTASPVDSAAFLEGKVWNSLFECSL